jgi:hypothetical protein
MVNKIQTPQLPLCLSLDPRPLPLVSQPVSPDGSAAQRSLPPPHRRSGHCCGASRAIRTGGVVRGRDPDQRLGQGAVSRSAGWVGECASHRQRNGTDACWGELALYVRTLTGVAPGLTVGTLQPITLQCHSLAASVTRLPQALASGRAPGRFYSHAANGSPRDYGDQGAWQSTTIARTKKPRGCRFA